MSAREFFTNVTIILVIIHMIHHSRELSETNSNDGNVLSIYDRVLGTFTPSERAYTVVYGLDDADPVRSASFPGLPLGAVSGARNYSARIGRGVNPHGAELRRPCQAPGAVLPA